MDRGEKVRVGRLRRSMLRCQEDPPQEYRQRVIVPLPRLSTRGVRQSAHALRNRFALRQNFFDDPRRLHAGEPLLEALVFERQPIVVDAETVEQRGVEVADVDWVLHDVVGEVVGGAVHDTWFDAAAGHPHAEAARVMVAAIVVFRDGAL